MTSITIGTDTYDVYGSVAGLKTYVGGRLGADAYTDASSNEKKQAMVMAARWIDRESWTGELTDTAQALAFPRTGITDCEGNAVDKDTVPTDVIAASYELVLILLADNTASSNATQGTNIKKAKAGSAQVEFFRPGSADGSGGAGTIFPVQAQKLLRCFLQGSAGISGPTASGTSQESSFCEDDFGLSEGLS